LRARFGFSSATAAGAACISGAGCGSDARGFCARGQNFGHANQRQVLTVALGALRAVLTTTLDVVDRLFAFDLVDHFGNNASASHHRHAEGDGFAANHQNLVELDLVTSIGGQLFNAQNVTRLHFVLLATGLEDRKHGLSFLVSASCGPRCRVLVGPFGPAFGQRAPVGRHQNESPARLAPRRDAGLSITGGSESRGRAIGLGARMDQISCPCIRRPAATPRS
jgi:hypothetical protein